MKCYFCKGRVAQGCEYCMPKNYVHIQPDVVVHLQKRIAELESENKRLIDAHYENAFQNKPRATAPDEKHHCTWRQALEATKHRSYQMWKNSHSGKVVDDE